MFIFCAVVTLRRGALLFLATFAAVFIIAAVFDQLLPPGSIRWSFAPPYLYRRPRVPFAVPFALKRLQRSFYSVFRAVLSDPNFRRVLLYLLHRSSLSHGSKHGKNAVIRGRGPPGARGARRDWLSAQFFIFCSQKFFFWKIPSLLPLHAHFNAKTPFFWIRSMCAYPRNLIEARICSKKCRFSHFLLKDE